MKCSIGYKRQGASSQPRNRPHRPAGRAARTGVPVDGLPSHNSILSKIANRSPGQTVTLRGEVKIVGGAFPAGQRFIVSARRVDLQNGAGVEIDAREQFVIENLAPGEYVIRVVPINSERLDPQIIRHLISLRERVVVTGGNQQPVSIVIDLSR